MPNTTDVSISAGATFDLNGINDIVDSISGLGSVLLGGAGLTVDETSGSRTFSGVISETGSIRKSGGHTWTLSGPNTFVGAVTIDGGVLSVGSNANLGDPTNDISLSQSTLQATGSFTSARDISLGSTGTIDVVTGATLTQQGLVSGSFALSKTGAGSLVLSAANTYTGVTNIDGGEVAVSAGTGLGAAGSSVNLSGGTLRAMAAFTNDRNVQVNGSGTFHVDPNMTLTQSGIISGSGKLMKLGTGTLLLTTPATTRQTAWWMAAISAPGTATNLHRPHRAVRPYRNQASGRSFLAFRSTSCSALDERTRLTQRRKDAKEGSMRPWWALS